MNENKPNIILTLIDIKFSTKFLFFLNKYSIAKMLRKPIRGSYCAFVDILGSLKDGFSVSKELSTETGGGRTRLLGI